MDDTYADPGVHHQLATAIRTADREARRLFGHHHPERNDDLVTDVMARWRRTFGHDSAPDDPAAWVADLIRREYARAS